MIRTAHASPGRLTMVGGDARNELAEFADHVRCGLTSRPKRLPCRFLYDEIGSALFEKICLQPEYYPTRAERQILVDQADRIADLLSPDTTVVELGSGSSAKTRILIEAFLRQHESLHYAPIDVSAEIVEENATDLVNAFPDLCVTAFVGEYDRGLRFVEREFDGPKCVLWLGSSIGNLDRDVAAGFLRRIADTMSDGDRLLVGIDLRKDRTTLESAYNDARGVTAAFNRNILQRINRELGGNFNVEDFDHRAEYNPQAGVVEISLVSTESQKVRVERLNLTVTFDVDEAIHTEDSHKYSEAEIDSLASRAQLATVHRWLDSERRFSLNLFAPAGRSERQTKPP